MLIDTGLTETSTVICSTPVDDIWFGSSGSLLPAVEAKIVSIEGNEITGYNQPGELVVKSPSVVLGYLNNETANKETFQDGWMRTGDEAVVKKGPKGTEHIWIVDRIKELIKVKVDAGVESVSRKAIANKVYRVYKLPLRSSKPTYSPTLLLQTVRSFLSPTTRLERSLKHMSSSRPLLGWKRASVCSLEAFRSMLRSIRLGTSG